jgi:glycosyltransferase involved in cell wall biosynthesis
MNQLVGHTDQELILSVLVLSYNQQKTILQTLESVHFQKTNFKFELIISDDASTDDTTRVAENFLSHTKKEHIFYRCLFHKSNKGVIKNFMDGVVQARGKYIAVVAGDDYWIDENKLQSQVNFLEAHPLCGLVHTGFNIFYEAENKTEPNLLKRNEGEIFENLLFANQIGALTAMYRRQLALNAFEKNIYQPQFLMEDYPLWLSIASVSKIGYIDKVTAVWRRSAESLSNSVSVSKNIIFEHSILMVQTYFAKLSKEPAIVLERLAALHHRHLMLAYIHKIKTVAKNSYLFLKQNNLLTTADKKYYAGVKFSGVSNVIRSVKNKLIPKK